MPVFLTRGLVKKNHSSTSVESEPCVFYLSFSLADQCRSAISDSTLSATHIWTFTESILSPSATIKHLRTGKQINPLVFELWNFWLGNLAEQKSCPHQPKLNDYKCNKTAVFSPHVFTAPSWVLWPITILKTSKVSTCLGNLTWCGPEPFIKALECSSNSNLVYLQFDANTPKSYA